MVERNWLKIQAEAKSLGQRLGEGPGEVQVVVASKRQPLERLRAAYGLGLRHFGENFLQEAQEKKKLLADLEITWHFFGRIQSNKAKDLVGEFELIHSVGRMKIVEALQSRAEQKGVLQKILLQVNPFGEASKDGFSAAEAAQVLEQAKSYPNLEICGLMAFPPLTDSEEVARQQFKVVRQLYEDLKGGAGGGGLEVLSMGTSGDYRAALMEGSSCLRLGEVLLGSREGGTR